MKRFLIPLTVILSVLLAAVLFLFLQRHTMAPIRTAELVPAEALFFLDLPDARRTAARWQQTALCQLLREPEVAAFLERPLAKVPLLGDRDARSMLIERVQPRQAFLAVSSLDGPVPGFVAGISFAGRRDDMEEWLGEPRASLQRAWPLGKAEFLRHGSSEIAVFTDGERTIAEAFREEWYFVSSRLDLLRATLDRFDSPTAAAHQSLAGSEHFQKAIQSLPSDADTYFFAKAAALTPALDQSGEAEGASSSPKPHHAQAFAGATRMEGGQFRDTLLLLGGAGAPKALERKGFALSSADTVFCFSGAIPESWELPASAKFAAGAVPAFSMWEKAIAASNGIGDVFGPEVHLLLDWSAPEVANAAPAFFAALDLRDREKARAFLEALTVPQAGQLAWTRSEQGSATYYHAPALTVSFSPVAALSEHFLVVGLSREAVATALKRAKSPPSHLSGDAGFRAAAASVQSPASAFAYLDFGRLFERAYGFFRPFLAMSITLSPELGGYLDAGKLPSAAVIARHLGPAIYSQSSVGGDTRIECVGPWPISQFVMLASAGWARFHPAHEDAPLSVAP